MAQSSKTSNNSPHNKNTNPSNNGKNTTANPAISN